MGIPLKHIIGKLPEERQKRIRKQAGKYIRDYKNLQILRKELGLTQSEIANRQGVRQVNISNLEKRSDMLISTLKKYVEAMGCELEIIVKVPDNSFARLDL